MEVGMFEYLSDLCCVEDQILEMLKLVLICVLYLTVCCDGAVHWCYEEQECEPSTWQINFPYCGLYSQSPINIRTSQTQYNSALGTLRITGTTGSSTAVVTNNGHTVEVTLSSVYTLSSKGLSDVYQLAGFHFHFGKAGDASQGSEHRINGRAYPLEIHFVFYNTKYATLADAKAQQDGLAVIGQLFEIGARNEILSGLINLLPQVAYSGQSVSFTVGNILSLNLGSYYRYQGSLTTPPCSENVSWHVISSIQQLDWSQYLTIVSSLYFTAKDDADQVQMTDNFRPVQPLNVRKVYKHTS
ncbi:carbonic anhydrase 2-like [Mixophyes fleayi]|uniref:carbonic anhydrase 2-like n=1 Tax=Mixophyes fleayi TaxID=3061075 RepID=UPI003F4D7CE0